MRERRADICSRLFIWPRRRRAHATKWLPRARRAPAFIDTRARAPAVSRCCMGENDMRHRARPSRRLVLGGILGAALGGVARAQPDTVTALYEKAKPEGSVTWYTSHYPAETAERIRRAFLEQYPDVKLNLLRAVSGVVFQRVSQELKANSLQCDLLGVSDMANVVAFKEQGLLERYTPANAETMLDLFRNLDPDGYFHATSCGVMAIT